jgi:hypothetical protein
MSVNINDDDSEYDIRDKYPSKNFKKYLIDMMFWLIVVLVILLVMLLIYDLIQQFRKEFEYIVKMKSIAKRVEDSEFCMNSETRRIVEKYHHVDCKKASSDLHREPWSIAFEYTWRYFIKWIIIPIWNRIFPVLILLSALTFIPIIGYLVFCDRRQQKSNSVFYIQHPTTRNQKIL